MSDPRDTQFARQILLLTQTALQQGRIDYPGKTQIYDLEDLHETLREALEGIEKLCSELLAEVPEVNV